MRKTNKKLTVVRPGTQSRRFTHVEDAVNTCFEAWKKRNQDIIALHTKRFLKL